MQEITYQVKKRKSVTEKIEFNLPNCICVIVGKHKDKAAVKVVCYIFFYYYTTRHFRNFFAIPSSKDSVFTTSVSQLLCHNSCDILIQIVVFIMRILLRLLLRLRLLTFSGSQYGNYSANVSKLFDILHQAYACVEGIHIVFFLRLLVLVLSFAPQL